MFSLPKNSKIVKGKTFGTKKNLVLNIYRWNRDNGKNPSINTYHLNKSKMGPMLLDAIMYIKNNVCLLYTSPSPRDLRASRMPSSA